MINNILNNMYQYLWDKPFIGEYIKKLKKVYQPIMPLEQYNIGIKAMKLLIKIIIQTIIILIIGICIGKNDVYYIGLMSIVAYILGIYKVNVVAAKEEEEILQAFESYLSSVSHSFREFGSVEEGIFESLEYVDSKIGIPIQKMYQSLQEENLDFECEEGTMSAKFLQAFFILCKVTVKYGDTIYEKQSLFLANLSSLKNEVNLELLKRKKIRHTFSGLQWIAVFPVFFLKSIANWGVSNLEELKMYYNGVFGIVTSVVLFLFSLAAFHIVEKLKENGSIYKSKHKILKWICKQKTVYAFLLTCYRTKTKKMEKIKELLENIEENMTSGEYIIRKIIIFFTTIIIILVFTFNLASISRHNIIHQTEGFNITGMVYSKKDQEDFKEKITLYSKKLISKEIDEVSLNQIILEEYKGDDVYLQTKIYEEILQRSKKYTDYQYPWYSIIIAFVIGWLACVVSDVLLWWKLQVKKRCMEEEIMRFYTVILMLVHLPNTNVLTILEWLEKISTIFKKSITETIDMYSFDEEEALSNLKNKERFIQFVRIVESLEACDKNGVSVSFSEIEGDRNYYLAKRKQDQEIFMSNRGAIAKVISYIPFALTLILYLIVPFVLESIKRLMGYLDELNTI